jgi:uncharacterized integral membrane protein
MTSQPNQGSAGPPAPQPGSAQQPGSLPQAGQSVPQPGQPSGQLPPQHVVKRTRVGGVWVASALFALLLLLLLIFILQNGQKVDIGYFGAHGHLPLGVALLLAAVLGVLLVVIPGTGRIIQLRIVARRHRRGDAARAAQPAAVQQGPDAQSAPTAQPVTGSQPAPGIAPASENGPVPGTEPASGWPAGSTEQDRP